MFLRRDLVAEAAACVRFETPPGRGVYLFVATLGYAR
jgi:hypothetical protein